MDMYEEVRKDYDALAHWYAENFDVTEILSVQFGEFCQTIKPGGQVLDLGCGPGYATRKLQERGFKPVGLDISPVMIQYAKKQFPQGTFEVGDMRTLPYPNNNFDAIWAAWSLIHVLEDDLEGVLAEMVRVSQPQAIWGIAMLETPDQTNHIEQSFPEQSDPALTYYRNLYSKQYFAKKLKPYVQEILSTSKVVAKDGDTTMYWLLKINKQLNNEPESIT